METITTELIDLAADFINRTNQHVYLTGKAGTGKTTFLHRLVETTHKKFVIVAPTGIAALNAKGVTIHSQFLLPPGTFIPDRNYNGLRPSNHLVYTPNDLVRQHPLNAVRRQVLRDLDVLIIDEVSMLRADLLDAIDYRLRYVKRNYDVPFGGVQVLMIGDLYQLPPVIRENERSFMTPYYTTGFFFEAQALQTANFVYIELDRIFRQSDPTFINLLNNLRNNRVTPSDIELLNTFYQPNLDVTKLEEVITLTTHNYKAEQMNSDALNALPGQKTRFIAKIEGEFPESMFPVSASLDLKVGAQVMFIKNDSLSGKYFNGKLAKVVECNEDDEIIVEMAGDHARLALTRETWENKRYTVNETSREQQEEVLGSFTHFPIKLAWAITVHKSQGLTFERAVIDVGHAFAPGQVYVALSRLRALEGLILLTKVHPGIIATDPQVVGFSSRQPAKETLPELLQSKQFDFLRITLHAAFSFETELREIDEVMRGKVQFESFEDPEMRNLLPTMRAAFANEFSNLVTFRRQIDALLHQGNTGVLLERLTKATSYYDDFLREQLKKLLVHIEVVKRLVRTKTYLNAMGEVDLLITNKREAIGKSAYLAACILGGDPIARLNDAVVQRKKDRVVLLDFAREHAAAIQLKTSNKSGVKRGTKKKVPQTFEEEMQAVEDYIAGVSKKAMPKRTKSKSSGSKPDTFQITFERYKMGESIADIARERGLSASTIENHVIRGISEGVLSKSGFLPENAELEIRNAIADMQPSEGTKVVFEALEKRFTYAQIRLVRDLMASE